MDHHGVFTIKEPQQVVSTQSFKYHRKRKRRDVNEKIIEPNQMLRWRQKVLAPLTMIAIQNLYVDRELKLLGNQMIWVVIQVALI